MTKDRLVSGEKRAERQVCFSVAGQLSNMLFNPNYIGAGLAPNGFLVFFAIFHCKSPKLALILNIEFSIDV